MYVCMWTCSGQQVTHGGTARASRRSCPVFRALSFLHEVSTAFILKSTFFFGHVGKFLRVHYSWNTHNLPSDRECSLHMLLIAASLLLCHKSWVSLGRYAAAHAGKRSDPIALAAQPQKVVRKYRAYPTRVHHCCSLFQHPSGQRRCLWYMVAFSCDVTTCAIVHKIRNLSLALGKFHQLSKGRLITGTAEVIDKIKDSVATGRNQQWLREPWPKGTGWDWGLLGWVAQQCPSPQCVDNKNFRLCHRISSILIMKPKSLSHVSNPN